MIKIFKDLIEEISDDNRKGMNFYKSYSKGEVIKTTSFFRPTISIISKGKEYKIIIENETLSNILMAQSENSFHLNWLREEHEKNLKLIRNLYYENLKLKIIRGNWLIIILIKLKIVK